MPLFPESHVLMEEGNGWLRRDGACFHCIQLNETLLFMCLIPEPAANWRLAVAPTARQSALQNALWKINLSSPTFPSGLQGTCLAPLPGPGECGSGEPNRPPGTFLPPPSLCVLNGQICSSAHGGAACLEESPWSLLSLDAARSGDSNDI